MVLRSFNMYILYFEVDIGGWIPLSRPCLPDERCLDAKTAPRLGCNDYQLLFPVKLGMHGKE
jgi:hypothetical protein